MGVLNTGVIILDAPNVDVATRRNAASDKALFRVVNSSRSMEGLRCFGKTIIIAVCIQGHPASLATNARLSTGIRRVHHDHDHDHLLSAFLYGQIKSCINKVKMISAQ